MTDSELNNITKEELLKNDFFIETQLNPSAVSDAFWANLLKEGKIDKQEFESAKRILLNLDTEAQLSVGDDIESRIWQRIESDIALPTRKLKRRSILFHPITIAACITGILFFSLITYIQYGKSTQGQDIASLSIANEELEKYKKSEEVLLVLSDDNTHVAKDGSVVDYSTDEEIKIDDQSIAKQAEKIEYNQLIVPYGKRTSIILADGSKIWLNAGTHIIYPSKFEQDKREIYVKGEVFADIVKDEKAPFFIKTDDLSVEVLGTKFNVNAYEGSRNQSVVLVEGSVSVMTKEKHKALLKPNQRFYHKGNEPQIENVDINNYVSWVDGYYSFKDEMLGVILDKLSNYYGVKIECGNKAYYLRCTGGLDLKDDFIRVLEGLKESTPTDYSYNEQSGKYIFVLKTD